MSDKFDPLKAWLGVSSSNKPSYYDLIGLANFESEPPIIADAADSAIAKVSENLGGEHHAMAEKLVRDLKSLKAVLLSAEKRRAYDEQLGKKLGVAVPSASSASLHGSLPAPAIGAADSPTMMLPPGALSALRSLDQVLGSAPPSAPGYGAQPGFPPGAIPPGAAFPPGAMPAGFNGQQPGTPHYGAPPYGAPQPNAPYGDPQFGGQQPQYGGPMGHAPNPYQQQPYADPNAGFNPNAGYPNSAFPNAGFGGPMGPQHLGPQGHGPQPQMFPGQMMPGPQGFDPQPSGNPFGSAPLSGGPFGAPASPSPNLGLGGPSALPGGQPAFGGAAVAPRSSSSSRPRVAAAKSQGSNMTVAMLVLGAAVVVLIIVIVVVQKYKGGDSGPPPLVAGKPHDAMNKPIPTPSSGLVPPLRPFEPVRIPVTTPTGRKPGENVPVTIDVSKEMDPRERRINEAMKTENLVPMLTGGKPIGGAPTPSGTAPEAMPAATAKPATMPAEAPGGLKGVVVPQVAMESGLPVDAKRAKEVPTMLKGSRGSMKARDYAKAEETILVAQITADSPELIQRAQAHSRALDLMRSFWSSAREGIKSLKAGDELTVGGKSAMVVKGDDSNLVVKMDGKDIAMVIDKLPWALAVQMAERSLGTDKPEGKLVVGTFLALDQGADAARGFTLIEESKGGDIEVDSLIDILKATD